MKKQRILILSTMMLVFLSSCGNQNKPSSGSTSGIENSSKESITNSELNGETSTNQTTSIALSNSGKVSFVEAVNYLNDATLFESDNAINAHVVKKEVAGSLTYVIDEEYSFYEDESSYSKGTVKRIENDEVTEQDTFEKRASAIVDKIDNQGQVIDYDVFVTVVDYKDDCFARNDYQDSVSKAFIVDSASQAAAGGLSTGEYVLKEDVSWEASAKAAHTLASFISADYYSNIYVQQLGINTINYQKDNEGNLVFSQSISYDYDGDMNDTQYFTLNISFTLAKDDMRLLTGYCESVLRDVNKSDVTDEYVKIIRNEYELTYGSKTMPSNDVMDVNDYFLSKVNDVQICDSYGKAYEANKVPLSATYLHAEALDYEPSKAVSKTLTNVSSSDSNIVKYENGYFHVYDTGTVTLTFSYSGKENGVSKIMTIKKEITIVLPDPTSITIWGNSNVNGDTLTKGNSYVYHIFVSPTASNQKITVEVGDKSILDASVNEDNDVVLNALEAGTTTLTVRSASDPSISSTRTIYVEDPNIDYTNYLTEHHYRYETTLYSHYAFDLVFNLDGTGELIQTVYDTNKVYTETFNWSLNGLIITFSNWSSTTPSYYQFDKMEIQLTGRVIYFSGGEEYNYKSFKFIDYENFLPLYKYEYEKKEGNVLVSKETFAFNRDGTGTKTVEVYNAEGTVADSNIYTFNWSLNDTTISFSSWSDNAKEEDKIDSILVVYDGASLKYNITSTKYVYYNKK